MSFLYRRTWHEVFVIPHHAALEHAVAHQALKTEIVSLHSVTRIQWRRVLRLMSHRAAHYLRWCYGSKETRLLLCSDGAELVHVEWIVPWHRIQRNYPFIPDGAYAVISCLTGRDFRGRGIFPSQLQRLAQLEQFGGGIWIWTNESNASSRRAIQKAGGMRVGRLERQSWFGGLKKKVSYYPEDIGSDPPHSDVQIGT